DPAAGLFHVHGDVQGGSARGAPGDGGDDDPGDGGAPGGGQHHPWPGGGNSRLRAARGVRGKSDWGNKKLPPACAGGSHSANMLCLKARCSSATTAKAEEAKTGEGSEA